MEDKYKTTMIGGFDNLNRPIEVAKDESLLIHKKYTNQRYRDKNQKSWINFI